MFNPDSLVLQLRTSRLQAGLLLLAGAGGFAAVWLNDLLDLTLSVFLTLALLLSLCTFAWRDVYRRSGDAVTGLHFGDGRWHLVLGDGRVERVHFMGAPFTGRHFLVLLFSGSGIGRRLVVIAADTMDADHWRRLRVLFRLGGVKPDQPKEGGVRMVSFAFGSRPG